MFSRQRSNGADGPRLGAAAGAKLSLAAVERGQACRVSDVVGEDAIANRLLEMGVVPGTTLTVLGAAMSGDPLEVSVRNYRLTVRRSEAERVLVEMLGE